MVTKVLTVVVTAILAVLAGAAPALAQLVPIVPGNYAIMWVRTSYGVYEDPNAGADAVIDGGSGSIRLERTDDPAAYARGLCPTPYVVGGTPTRGGQFWCINEDGSSYPNFNMVTWNQLTPTVAKFGVSQSYHGSTYGESLEGIALLAPPPPPPPPATLKVFITQPKASASVKGTVWIVLWVEGTSGASNTFTLSADGKQVSAQTTSARGPVSIPWPTQTLPNGTHTLTGTVRDAAGNTGVVSINVLVTN